MARLKIQFDTGFVLDFAIQSHAIAALWLQRFQDRHAWPMDDTRRFYGFKDADIETARARDDLVQCILTINAHEPIIDRDVTDLQCQDTLNYLHSIFERYHGLLDQQNTAWWMRAPPEVRQAMANLNIAIHRMESAKHNLPRLVCTWFGMPKNHVLDPELQRAHGSVSTQWGGVYLNYVEIGKTLEDLAHDDDRWVGQDAFQPFRHYSADFNVRFYDSEIDLDRVRRYWQQHRDFFAQQGLHTWDDAAALPYRFKIAQLNTDLPRSAVLTQLREVDHIVDTYIQ
jgi:hypothetical protein